MHARLFQHPRLAGFILASCFSLRLAAAPLEPLSLAGPWRFALDRQDAGLAERWQARTLEQSIQLPGALQTQGYGDDISVETQWTANVNDRTWYESPAFAKYRQPGNVKVPFWLQPDKHYVGVAWYQRTIEIPASWAGRRAVLTLERPHWETRVWVDDRLVGTNVSLSTPHVYELGTQLAPGTHRLTVRVDNRLIVNVGVWAHSVSDHTQGNWNGLVGRLELAPGSPVWIDDAQVYPNVAERSARFKVHLGNATGQPGQGTLKIGKQKVPVSWDAQGGNCEATVSLGAKARTWDEFDPALQHVQLQLTGSGVKDERTVTFGFREIGTTPDRLLALNDRRLYLRGTLECCIFPKTGYPPTDVAAWKRIIRICQEHGLNHLRFHSWCPPEAAFAAADELGFYYQVEIAAWTNVGDGAPVDQWLYDEAGRILRAYGNHPSFLLMPYGNEPGGPKHEAWLKEWVKHWKARDTRRLYTTGSGWPTVEENQYHVNPWGRGRSGWVGGDWGNATKNLKAPLVLHELAQWCVYPNFDEIAKYTGPLKAKNFEIFRDSLEAHGLLDQWRAFLRASGKLQALCYKEEIEAAFRTPGVSGVQLLDLHDFPGQGSALVGVLDPFWDSKGYITPAEFRRFYGPTVPLARMERRVWTTDQTLIASLELAHFGATPLRQATPYWRLLDVAGKCLASGELPARDIPVDRGIILGKLELPLAQFTAPARVKLVVGLKGTAAENDWTLFLYPPQSMAAPAGVLITNVLNDEVLARLAAGGRVLVATSKLSAQHPRGSFTPVFWNRQWFPSQECQTLGLLCDPKHPALAAFPTEGFTDFQWEEIVSQSRAVVLDELPRQLRPVVQFIDDWNTNRKLGLVFECRVGPGRLLFCSAELQRDLASRPAARQLRDSLAAYAGSAAFAPQVEVAPDQLQRLLGRDRLSNLVKLDARIVSVSSEDTQNGNGAARAIDGDDETIWHTRWQPANDPMPHHLVIDLGREVTLKGITYLPRQAAGNGRLGEFEVCCANDPGAFGTPSATAKGRDNSERMTIAFPQPITARYLKLLIKSEANGHPFASVAELDVVVDGL